MWPKVSIIWLNYNSSKIMPLVLESLKSILSLDYPLDKIELIVVDNCSNDDSFERIKEFLEKRNGLKKKIIRLNKNLGFTGGNNIGFKVRDKESKYVLLLNNDAIIFQNGLKSLVEYAEINSNVACLQGVVLKYGTRLIDTAGNLLDEFLHSHFIGAGHEYPWVLRKPIYVTYVDGSSALYRVKSLMKCLGDKLFIDEFFGYSEDSALGLMMWNYGYKSVAIPEPVAAHARNLTFRSKTALTVYLSKRNRIALALNTNTRYKDVVLIYELNYMLRHIAASTLKMLPKSYVWAEARSIIDGIKLARKLRSKGIFIDIYKAPVIRVPIRYIETFFAARRVATKYFDGWDVRVLNSLTVE